MFEKCRWVCAVWVAALFGLILTVASRSVEAQTSSSGRRASAQPWALAAPDRTIPIDDWTFRPTVVIRKGDAQGSGTIISSVNGETLVLTAAHVVAGSGDLRVELHRFNLGVERQNVSGPWPRKVPARILGQDEDADVAVLQVPGLATLPHVARLADLRAVPEPGTIVTSVGIDRASDLNSWQARVRGMALMAPERGRQERYYVVTDRAPIQGRSGGGLYLPDGRLLGVCVGRIEPEKGEAIGLFASGDSIRRVLLAIEKNEVAARKAIGEESSTSITVTGIRSTLPAADR